MNGRCSLTGVILLMLVGGCAPAPQEPTTPPQPEVTYSSECPKKARWCLDFEEGVPAYLSVATNGTGVFHSRQHAVAVTFDTSGATETFHLCRSRTGAPIVGTVTVSALGDGTGDAEIRLFHSGGIEATTSAKAYSAEAFAAHTSPSPVTNATGWWELYASDVSSPPAKIWISHHGPLLFVPSQSALAIYPPPPPDFCRGTFGEKLEQDTFRIVTGDEYTADLYANARLAFQKSYTQATWVVTADGLDGWEPTPKEFLLKRVGEP